MQRIVRGTVHFKEADQQELKDACAAVTHSDNTRSACPEMVFVRRMGNVTLWMQGCVDTSYWLHDCKKASRKRKRE